MKRTSQIAPHRTDPKYVMAGNALTLKPRYLVDEEELSTMKEDPKATEKRPSIKPRTPRASELAAARKASKSATKSGRQSTTSSAGKDPAESSSFLLTQADPAAVQAPDSTPRKLDLNKTEASPAPERPAEENTRASEDRGTEEADQNDADPANKPAGKEEEIREGGDANENGEEEDEGGEEKGEVNGSGVEEDAPGDEEATTKEATKEATKEETKEDVVEEETGDGQSVPNGTAGSGGGVDARAASAEEKS